MPRFKLNPNFLGHIKLFLEVGSSLYKISLTTSEEEPTYDFIPSASENNAGSNLKVLSAVTGIESGKIKEIVQTAVETVFKKYIV